LFFTYAISKKKVEERIKKKGRKEEKNLTKKNKSDMEQYAI